MRNLFIAISTVGILAVLVFLLFRNSNDHYEPVTEVPDTEVEAYFQKMDTALRERRYAEGRHLAQKALHLSREKKYRSGEVYALMALGYIYFHYAKYDSSIMLLEQCRAYNKKYQLDPYLYHKAGVFLAESYERDGQSDKAVDCLQEALDYAFEKKDTLEICANLNALGNLYRRLGYFEKSEETFKEGLGLSQNFSDTQYGGGSGYYIRSFTGNLGILYKETGKYEQAIPLLTQSLELGRKNNDPTSQSIDLKNLASIHLSRGNFQKAMENWLDALEIAENIGENEVMISTNNHLGQLFTHLNDFERATHFYQKNLDFVEKELNSDHLQFPDLYWHLARFNIKKQAFEDAKSYLTRAIEGYNGKNFPIELGGCYLTLGEIQFFEEDYTGSTQSIHKGLEEVKDISVDPAFLSEAYLQLGANHLQLGKNDSARHYLQLVSEIAPHDAETAWKVHYYLAQYHFGEKDINLALQHAEESIAAIENMRQYTVSPELSSSFLNDKIKAYHQYFEILYSQYKKAPAREKFWLLLALAEKTRSRALLENMRSSMHPVFRQHHESAALQEIETQMVALNRFIREEKLKPANEQRRERLNTWQQQLENLRQQFQVQTARFAAENRVLSTMIGAGEGAKVRHMQEYLAENQALIAYYLTNSRTYAFVITPSDGRITQLGVSPEMLTTSIHQLRQPFQDYKENKIDFLHLKFDADESSFLFDNLLFPVQEQIAGYTKLTIVPHGPLHYLPFEMLVTGKKDTVFTRHIFNQYRQYRYFIEDFTIGYLPSTTLLPVLKQRKKNYPSATLMALGNPLSNTEARNVDASVLHNLPSGLREMALTPLPGASIEVAEIGKMYDEEQVKILSGPAASEHAFKKDAHAYGYIHFATHGYVHPQNPNFSALLLNPGDETEDGFLHAYEIYGVQLNAHLVSLSACETAMGKLQPIEGLVSLVQPFIVAGCQKVMATLWSMDEVTYPLMVSFYEKLQQGMAETEALREAKLEFMQGTSRMNNMQFSHANPFLWAPFVLFGS